MLEWWVAPFSYDCKVQRLLNTPPHLIAKFAAHPIKEPDGRKTFKDGATNAALTARAFTGREQKISRLRVHEPICKWKLISVCAERLMRGFLSCVFAYAGAFCATALAQTPDVSSPISSPSKVRTFVIEPDQSEQTFMCESGRVQSVLTFATAEHRIVSVVFLDKAGVPVPADVWGEAFGFRLLHRQTVRIEAAMICGG